MLIRTLVLAAGPLILLIGGCPTQQPAGTNTPTATTIRFDNGGASDFTISGAAFSGGEVGTQGIPPLYSSGAFAYEIENGTATITLDPPAELVSFFYVHGGATPAGTATAFDATGNTLGSVDSNAATTFGDSGNIVTMDFAEPIARIELTGGVVDDFTFTPTGG